MFALFFSLYYAMFTGTWTMYSLENISQRIAGPLGVLSGWTTSLFNGTTQSTNILTNLTPSGILNITSLVLALITSIGIVVMAVKGVKKAFGIFFMGIR